MRVAVHVRDSGQGIEPALLPQIFDLFTQAARSPDRSQGGLGIGLEQQFDVASDPNFLWHWGDNGSWKNFVLAHPESKSAIVVFTNGSRGLNVANRVMTAATGRQHAAFLWL